jgi:hypothetical protein
MPGRTARSLAAPDAIARLVYRDPAKAVVMTYFRRLVTDGYAEWHMLENGDIQLRLPTGETYPFAKTMITCIA